MLKKIFISILLAVFFLFITAQTLAAENTNIYFFWAKGCPHCAKEKIFLSKIKDKYPQVEILDFDITASRQNLKLMEKIGKNLNADISGVPFTVIGEHYFSGYYNEETTGKEIEQSVICALETKCQDLAGQIINGENQTQIDNTGIPQALEIPILGQVYIKDLSLPALTIFIGFLDGFNPCAMWALLFLISLLLGMKDKKRMWILGIAFVVTSALIYFLFMSAWLNLFLFLGFVLWVRIVVGLVAVSAGSYNLRDWWVNRDGGCHVVASQKRKRVFEKIKDIVYKKQFVFALLGIILLAVAVNMVELVCSAGLPAIYTRILTLSNLPAWQYYSYLALYVFFFMLDDLFVFFVAMTTLKAVGIENKYSRYSKLIGGILMVVIGILMLFKPEFLMFG